MDWLRRNNKNKTINMEAKATCIPVKEFAQLKGITVQAVYQGIKRGKYKSVKIGTYTLVLK